MVTSLRRRSALTATIILVAIGYAAFMTERADAGTTAYCTGSSVLTYNTCGGPQHSLRQNWAFDYYGLNNYVGAWATLNGSLYASVVIARQMVCHPYGGGNVLAPLVYNPYPNALGQAFYLPMAGLSYWGSEGAC